MSHDRNLASPADLSTDIPQVGTPHVFKVRTRRAVAGEAS
jgi:hypothetical protein